MIGGIAARRVSSTGVDSTEIVLQQEKINFLFIGRRRISQIIDDAPWATSLRLAPERVYARTADGVFLTRLKSLSEAERLLREYGPWLRVHQSALVNASLIKWIELGATTRKLIGFETKDGRRTGEGVEIGPTYIVSVRSALAFRTRRPCSKTKSSKKAKFDKVTSKWAHEDPQDDDPDDDPGPTRH